MLNRRVRLCITASLLIGGIVLLKALDDPPRTPARQRLASLPLEIDEWKGADILLTDSVLAAAGVDDYVSRAYLDANQNEVELYVGYYAGQRSGDVIHSPKNCLPAAGWVSARQGRLSVPVLNGQEIEVNDFRITKGRYQDLVLYWYQGRGRVIANEYQAKFWTMFDAAVRHRTDGSLVRLVIPVRDEEAKARETGVRFLKLLYPHLNNYIPN